MISIKSQVSKRLLQGAVLTLWLQMLKSEYLWGRNISAAQLSPFNVPRPLIYSFDFSGIQYWGSHEPSVAYAHTNVNWRSP
jgi:hypothetical protein